MPTNPKATQQIKLFGMTIDSVDMQQAVARVLEWIESGDRQLRYVVTPNVNHAIMFQDHEGLRAAYADASLVIADGMPLVLAARWLGRDLPDRVAGSDLAPAVIAKAGMGRGIRVFLLGGAEGVAERAAAVIDAQFGTSRVVGCYAPPLGFEHDAAECEKILKRVNEATPDLLLIGLGAPKQELWVHRFRRDLRVPAALCIGATIDFIAGNKPRAPDWMRRTGVEWIHRVVTEPRRLAGRYARDGMLLPGLFLREWWQARQSTD